MKVGAQAPPGPGGKEVPMALGLGMTPVGSNDHLRQSHQESKFRAQISLVREPAACLQAISDVYKLAQMLTHHHNTHSKLLRVNLTVLAPLVMSRWLASPGSRELQASLGTALKSM